jgi:hypothetical protein
MTTRGKISLCGEKLLENYQLTVKENQWRIFLNKISW